MFSIIINDLNNKFFYFSFYFTFSKLKKSKLLNKPNLCNSQIKDAGFSKNILLSIWGVKLEIKLFKIISKVFEIQINTNSFSSFCGTYHSIFKHKLSLSYFS